MARRRYQQSGGFAPPPSVIPSHPVLGPIFYLMVMCVAGVIIIVCFGPIVDYFSAYLSTMPVGAAPYANPVLEMMPWVYWFAMALGAVGAIGIFLAVIRQIYYSRYGD